MKPFIYPLPALTKVFTKFVKNRIFPNANNMVQFKASGYILLAYGIKAFLIFILLIHLNCATASEKYIEAAADGDITEMEAITKKHGDLINSREYRNWTPLIAAASMGKLDVVKYLIQKNAKLNLRTNLGDTAIYKASSKGYTDIVKLLLSEGANPNIKDKKGDSPLTKASSKGNIEIMRLLLEAKVNPNEVRIPGIDATTPLMAAAEEDQVEAMNLLLKYKADINARNQNGDTALSIASSQGKVKSVKFLIESGANVHNVSFFGLTPILHASENGYRDIIIMLKKVGATE